MKCNLGVMLPMIQDRVIAIPRHKMMMVLIMISHLLMDAMKYRVQDTTAMVTCINGNQ